MGLDELMTQPYMSLEAELHDAFWEAEDDASEIQWMASILRKYPGPSLEVGAGSGRLMYALIQQGYEVEGLELSADMLALGRNRAAKMNLNPIIHIGDMTTWLPTRRYASVLAPAFTLQLADDPLATLRHWGQWLENGGGLYVTVFMPYAELLGDLPEGQWYHDHQANLKEGRKGLLETRHKINLPQQVIHREHRYTLLDASDQVIMKHESFQKIRWIEHQQMLVFLKDAGFELERYFLDFDANHCPVEPDDIDFGGIITYQAQKKRPN